MNMQTLKISRFLGLALAGVALACAMSGAFAAGTTDQDADMQAVNNFRLDDQVLTRYTAVLKNLVTLQKQHPEVMKQMNKDGDSSDTQTIGQAIAVINRHPQVRDAVTRTGMSVANYITCTYALVQTAVRAMALKQGAPASSIPSGIPTDNLHYYQANKVRFDALNKLMAQTSSDSDQ
ncbi:MAG: hypothetical protein ACRETC_07375 [Gammaproteobacteria bacterium]